MTEHDPHALALTVDEIAEMVTSWHVDVLRDMRTHADRIEAILAYVEHMRAGGFAVGHDWEPTQ